MSDRRTTSIHWPELLCNPTKNETNRQTDVGQRDPYRIIILISIASSDVHKVIFELVIKCINGVCISNSNKNMFLFIIMANLEGVQIVGHRSRIQKVNNMFVKHECPRWQKFSQQSQNWIFSVERSC